MVVAYWLLAPVEQQYLANMAIVVTAVAAVMALHDLRHTGNTMAAAQGASLKELMERMGHSSTRAALIYLHATRERDQEIAAGMGKPLRRRQRTA